MVLQKYLTHFASDYWFYKISWTLYGHLGVLFVWLGICACGRRFPYIVQEINQNLITGSIEKNKQNPFLVIGKCWKYGKQLYQTTVQSYIILGEMHPLIDIATQNTLVYGKPWNQFYWYQLEKCWNASLKQVRIWNQIIVTYNQNVYSYRSSLLTESPQKPFF